MCGIVYSDGKGMSWKEGSPVEDISQILKHVEFPFFWSKSGKKGFI
jgi:hypothetical protein